MKDLKTYYTIGEVALMFDVNVSLIRYWSNTFKQIKPHKNKKGNRLFTTKDIENFKLIYHLVKEKGLTLKGAQIKLKETEETENPTAHIITKLLDIRKQLIQLKDQMDKKEKVHDQNTTHN
ncbi:MerR family transcriptional regulator [Halosquirtibacter laminarini]|uniref:MerR family transcriptional regulator n=1 Tax=Halosquirtibacter laminarini TaxID=3374600 RepID=A0AC61NP49_9BACT|nr:MerR family transcriptional regulator [Prolixibacteraceae bacterium]